MNQSAVNEQDNSPIALVTGATGMVGYALVPRLLEKGYRVRRLIHRPEDSNPFTLPRVETIAADLTRPESLSRVCNGVDVVFHLASYAPHTNTHRSDHNRQHRLVTVEGTKTLATLARNASVRRFVFTSSVKAMGESTARCEDELAASLPQSVYGQSKLEAEAIVRSLPGVETTIVRLAPLYGPHGHGWIKQVVDAMQRGRFPPLPKTENKKSMVHADDVATALILAARHPRAVNRTYLLTDDETYSTRAIYEAICRALGRTPPTWGVPLICFRIAATIFDGIERISGARMPFGHDAFETLFGTAWYSSARIRQELGWKPAHNVYEYIAELAAAEQQRVA